MTAFLPEFIPPQIDTFEKLVVWGMEVLSYQYPALTATEFLDNDQSEVKRLTVETNLYFITAVEPPIWRHVSRFSVPVSPDYKVTGRIWEHAEELGNLPVPAGMKAR